MIIETIKSERLLLRPFRPGDADEMSKIYSDETVMKYIGRGGPANKEQTLQIIEAFIDSYDKHGFGIMGVTEKTNVRLIGHCGFNFLRSDSEIEIAYLLDKKYWGKGYATEIASSTLEFGFNILKLKKIVALAYPENVNSVNVINKLGMTAKGYRRHFGIDFLYFSKENPANQKS